MVYNKLYKLRVQSHRLIEDTLRDTHLKNQEAMASGQGKKIFVKNEMQHQKEDGFINCLIQRLSTFIGPKPSSREQFTMSILYNSLFVFGGLSSSSYNDLKSFDLSRKEWKSLITNNSSNPISKRFGHSMCSFKGALVIFGGGGSQIAKIKRRETFNDLYMVDS